MQKKVVLALMMMTMVAVGLTGCGKSGKTEKLDPENPVSLTVWHYYNGAQQANFDELAEEFNATVGKEKGIYVEGYSQGSVSDLEQAISSSLAGEVGAGDLPDIFSSYADTAYSAQQADKLVDLTEYFSEEELAEYVDSYIEEGYFNGDGALYLLPVAKSTEITILNKTDWEPFAQATGTTTDELSTVEGITEVAQRYYEWTDSLTPDIPDDGKAFYGRDAMANYMIISMRQMGQEIFEVKDGKVVLHTDRELIHRLWENYYVPYVKGYFGAYGKFRSDDVKTGDILAYTGSTSSVLYFPDQVETEEDSYPIDFVMIPAPVMEGGENYRVQQGAGMAITKSDDKHEYAASLFLKWFTEKEQNLRFISDSGYMPVRKDANSMEVLDEVLADNNIEMNDKAYTCLSTVMQKYDQDRFYTTKNFENGYQMRNVLDSSLSDRAEADKAAIDEAVAAGADRKSEEEKYTAEESFDSWYDELCGALTQMAEQKSAEE